jgi:hypothetical protein
VLEPRGEHAQPDRQHGAGDDDPIAVGMRPSPEPGEWSAL